VGIRELRIFLRGRRLFMYMETEDDFDPGRDFARVLDAPRYREWDELMRSLQERAPEAAEDEWWAPMEEVFDLGWPGGARVST
jgi:L-rhamnose mutarotase